jgi:single-strand DNA-binding protein
MPTDLEFSDPSLGESTDPFESAGFAGSDPTVGDRVPLQTADNVTNLVLLTGSVTEPAERRELAGGIPVVRWTLRVPRGSQHPGSDLMDCVALNDDLKARALGWPIGLPVSIVGALRRRFFRSGGRTTTRVEIEVERVTELDAAERAAWPRESAGVEQADQ